MGSRVLSVCRACDGSGVAEEEARVTVQLPKGAPAGFRVMFPGSGDFGSDVVVHCVETKGMTGGFSRAGSDLRLSLHIPLADALCGVHTTISSLDDRCVLSRKQSIHS